MQVNMGIYILEALKNIIERPTKQSTTGFSIEYSGDGVL